MTTKKKAVPRICSFAMAALLLLGSISPALAADTAGLTDFAEANPNLTAGQVQVDKTAGTVTVGNTHGDHFAAYNGEKTNDFILEADVELVSGGYDESRETRCAGLIFGLGSQKTTSRFWRWNCANIDAGRTGEDAFRVFGPGIPDTNHDGALDGVDPSKPIHLKMDMKATGEFTYTFGNVGGEMRTLTDKINDWTGGYVGVMSFCTEARFSKISFQDRADHSADSTPAGPAAAPVELKGDWKTNLTDLTAYGGTWEVRENGLYSSAVDKGNCWVYSKATGTNFVYSTDVTFLKDAGAATLLFRSAKGEGFEDCYAMNIDGASQECKMWRQELVVEDDQSGSFDVQLMDAKKVDAAADKTYHLTAVAIGSWLQFYVNGELVGSTGDYTLQPGNKGQDTYLKSGCLGLLNWNGEMVFQNTYYTPVDDKFTPLAKDINITSSTGTVEDAGHFRQLEPIMIQYVGNDAATVNVNVTPVSSAAKVTVQGPDGKDYPNGKNIPVSVGKNYVVITITDEKYGDTATATYRVNVHRRQAGEVYYNEPYRGQYHYSVKDGWANDPNGMVYADGVWHLFYQFDDDPQHAGQVHWAHATSKDLVTWEEHPIAFYPDAYGAMFSGCAVLDEDNTSGLFPEGKGGLVAIVTADGNGERIEAAHSEDGGLTWIKEEDIVLDWSDDPLQVRDFRDPKVFRWEGKWFMVIAGGPLRIYSSDNLLDWTCESTYPDLHTECPDLYPIQTADGTVKWALSRGGRFYKIGDFTQVKGKWTFVPDEAYKDKDGVMNFGQDSYAAMTFYTQDFGTAAKPTIPEIIEINWMNTWNDGYCQRVASAVKEKAGVDQQFNGTFNLLLKLGLEKRDGKYALTQTPIEQYEGLRDKAAVTLTGAEVTGKNDLLKDFKGDCYEIAATFTPDKDTSKVGFRLREGGSEATVVTCDLKTDTISIDRSQSGVLVSDVFKTPDSQKITRNADGTVDLHIYVDRASVEVFTSGYAVAGAEQIFPKADSTGVSVFAEGGTAKADITIYPMNSIWNASAPAAETDVTRGEAALELYQREGSPKAAAASFSDVKADSEYAAAVGWTCAEDIMSGYANTFRPEQVISRQELAAVLARYGTMKGCDVGSSDLKGVSDQAEIAGWALESVGWAVKAGVLPAEDGKFNPNAPVTRTELQQSLDKLDQLTA